MVNVSVVIPCYGHAHFLGAAIESVLAQSIPGVEIVVVDDGSPDNTSEVASSYPEVRLVRQDNAGLSAARNAGLAVATGRYVTFLDADDLLISTAIADGLAAFRACPDAVFVAGGHRRIDTAGSPIATPPAWPIGDDDPYLCFLRGNWIGMHATVLYLRDAVVEAGGFDTELDACEDYDLYLRMARSAPVHQYASIVAEYRWHGSNMSGDVTLMLSRTLSVLVRQFPYVVDDPIRYDAVREGFANWMEYYRDELGWERIEMQEQNTGAKKIVKSALTGARRTAGKVRRSGVKVLQRVGAIRTPRPGAVDLGDLRRLSPISSMFGYDRGRPVDRCYIEEFLASQAADLHGRVLEIGDDSYIRAYGGDRVESYEVLHLNDTDATYVGTLEDGSTLPSNHFDCIVLTQTLHLIFDLAAAVATIERILAPGGVLLATFPGVSQVSRDEWSETWSWSMTPYSVRRLFAEGMPDAVVDVASRGNVLACTAFLHGMADSELTARELEHHDPAYPLIVTARVLKPL